MTAGVRCGQTRIQPVSHCSHPATSQAAVPGPEGADGKTMTEQVPMLALRRTHGGCRQRPASSLRTFARGRSGHTQAAGKQQ
jgi:hypothetical protein